MSESWPATWGVTLMPSTRRPTPRVLVGGVPMRVLRLSGRGVTVLDRLTVSDAARSGPGAGQLARRLTDADVAAPAVPPGAPHGVHTVAVVIPVRDRPAGLADTLGALGTLGTGALGALQEVIVVDDASLDPAATDAVVTAAGTARVIRRSVRGGPAAARNTGWREARADIVVFLDAECVPAGSWLTSVLRHFDDSSVAAVGPRVTARRPDRCRGAGRIARWIDTYETIRSPLDLGPIAGPVRPGTRIAYLPSAALAVRRDVLAQTGGFDEEMLVGEDVDLVWRLAADGWRIRYEPAAIVTHPSRAGGREWLQQRRSYGSSAAPLAARHGAAVAPAVITKVGSVAWCAAALASPGAAIGAGALAAGWSGLRLRKVTSLPAPEVLRLSVAGHLRSGQALAEAVRRSWWPGALLAGILVRRPTGRIAALVAFPLLVEWQRAGRPLDPLRWVILRLADDVAYGAGVWSGAWRARSARALYPRLARPGPAT